MADNIHFRTPLKRSKGLGAARTGTWHWAYQRLTACALIPLTFWFLLAALRLVRLNYGDALGWLSQPLHAFLMSVFVLVASYHAYLGAQVVCEDYLHRKGVKFLVLIGLKGVFFLLPLVSLFSILTISFSQQVMD